MPDFADINDVTVFKRDEDAPEDMDQGWYYIQENKDVVGPYKSQSEAYNAWKMRAIVQGGSNWGGF